MSWSPKLRLELWHSGASRGLVIREDIMQWGIPEAERVEGIRALLPAPFPAGFGCQAEAIGEEAGGMEAPDSKELVRGVRYQRQCQEQG